MQWGVWGVVLYPSFVIKFYGTHKKIALLQKQPQNETGHIKNWTNNTQKNRGVN
jgi:hypothetical protein